MLNTNSDGSFHKPKAIKLLKIGRAQSVGGTGVINVHAPEAYSIKQRCSLCKILL